MSAAEMAFAGGFGARIQLAHVPRSVGWHVPERNEGRVSSGDHALRPSARATQSALLFSESNTRFLCEIRPENAAAFEARLAGVPHARIGEVTAEAKLEIRADNAPVVSADLSALKETWQKPLRW